MDSFQSLIGFKINWNDTQIKNLEYNLLFQSLIGFKINWNAIRFNAYFSGSILSIPNRV